MSRAIIFAKRSAVALIVLAGIGAAALSFAYPAIAAGLCATCKGMVRVNENVVVDPAMSPRGQARLLAQIERARAQVAGRWPGELQRANWVVCVSVHCDRAMGGRGARAITLSLPMRHTVHVSPAGLSQTILAHELFHVALHSRVGVRRQITGALPAWLNEGLAVLVSGDRRYLNANGQPLGCSGSAHALPASPFEWAPASGRDPDMYRRAACAVAALDMSMDEIVERLEAGWTP